MHIKIDYESGLGSGTGSGSSSGSISDSDEYGYSYDYSSCGGCNSSWTVFMHILIMFLICLCCLITSYLYDIIQQLYIKLKNIKCIKCKTKCVHCKLNCLNYKNKVIPTHDEIETDDCVICMDNNDKTSIKLLCRHKFHSECITRWINTSIESGSQQIQCPLCRSPI